MMMTTPADATTDTREPADARELQARLYREIGISAVAAALHFVKQPDPGAKSPTEHELPLFLRDEHMAA